MAARWTEEQKEAIHLRNCNILVSAAAGSGKTAVLVERIFSMLTDPKHPLNIDQLLVVTFTNAAAAEMKERVEDRLMEYLDEFPENEHVARQLASIHSAQIMTIHSFCLYVIRNHFNEIDLDPAFRIGEETELKLLKGDVVKKLMETCYESQEKVFLDFVECFAKGKMDEGIEEMILSVYEYSRSYPSADDWLDGCLESFQLHSGQELDELPSVEFLKSYIRQIIPELKASVHKGLDLCREPDGPCNYEPMLIGDEKKIRSLEHCVNYEDYYNILAGMDFEPLSRKKMPDASEKKKEQVKSIRSFIKDTLNKLKEDYFNVDSHTAARQMNYMFPYMKMLTELVKEFSQKYQEAKEAKNIVDFGDLEHFALKILTEHRNDCFEPTEVALELSEQYEEILIDEYQDSNQVQETILNSISRERKGRPNMFMVGDVKQSIYKFRLAKPELFMEKYKTYPSRDDRYQRVELHKNFRSRNIVLESVNFLFRKLMAADLGDIDYDDDAALYPGAEFKVPENKELVWSDCCEMLLVTPSHECKEKLPDSSDIEDGVSMTSQELEAYGIAARINEMVNSEHPLNILDKNTGEFRPVTYGDIVILLRTMSGWADTFVKVLGDENIPALAETVTGFFSAMEIQLILSYLSIVDNPRQDIPLAAVLKSPIVGLDDEQLAMIISVYGKREDRRRDLYDCCRQCLFEESYLLLGQYYSDEQITGLRSCLHKFFVKLDALRECVPYTPVHELILKVYESTGYYAYACAMPGGKGRQANLDMLVEKALDFEKTSYRGLFNFIRYVDKLKAYEVDFGEAASEGCGDTVRIMSIHKSKGLEYPVVIAAGLGKTFNQQDARSSLIIHSDYGFGPDVIDPQWRLKTTSVQKKILAKKTVMENLGEELRVLYVALTRAREKLILCGYIENLEKALDHWCQDGYGYDLLPFKIRQGAKCYLDWIMPVLVSHRSAGGLLNHYGINGPVLDKNYKDTVNFYIREMNAREIITSVAQKTQDYVIKKDIFEYWDSQREYMPEMHANMDRLLGWHYPYEDQLHLHTKMTVSELKRIVQLAPDDDGLLENRERSFFSDIDEHRKDDHGSNVIEGVQSLQERMERAALRGTTVHKILELIDIQKINSLKDVYDFVSFLSEAGKIDPLGAALVYVPGIYKFVCSPLARRMAAAEKANRLYKEKPFVIGVSMETIDPSVHGDDEILIQGIIDVWFIEDDQIIIVDYKTDYVEDDGTSLILRYKAQLNYYALALEQMTDLKVKEKIIFSLALGKELQV